MRFTESFVNEIKMRLPISSVIGTKLNFDTRKSNIARGNYWACCPFHAEKTPSFCCNDPRASYHCFGCHESGDIFSFLMKIEGLSFSQAVEKLSSMAGLSMPEQTIGQKAHIAKKISLYQILEYASNWYKRNLDSDIANEAREYLKQRHLTAATIQEFNLGYVGNQKFALKNYLNKLKITDEELLEVGLLARSDTNDSVYERFSDRIIFPIKDTRGRIVAFGGRAMQNAKAKYLNSSESSIFHKGRLLYNLHQAREFCYQQRKMGDYKNSQHPLAELIVVEGYMDVISLHQAGLKNAVAPLGTALTEEQMALIWQSSLHPILCFDGDEAGQRAAYRTIERMLPNLRADISLRFALLPSGLDPDDIIKKEGKTGFLEYLENAISLLDLLWLKETKDKDFTSPEACATAEKNLLMAAQSIKDKNLQQHYAQTLKARLKNFFFALRRGIYDVQKARPSSSLLKELEQKLMANMAMREEVIIAILLGQHSFIYSKFDEISLLNFTNKKLKAIHALMIKLRMENIDIENFSAILQQRIDPNDLSYMKKKMSYMGINSKDEVVKLEKILEQSLYLYNKMHILKEELPENEKQIRDEASFFSMLVNIKNSLTALEKAFIVKD